MEMFLVKLNWIENAFAASDVARVHPHSKYVESTATNVRQPFFEGRFSGRSRKTNLPIRGNCLSCCYWFTLLSIRLIRSLISTRLCQMHFSAAVVVRCGLLICSAKKTDVHIAFIMKYGSEASAKFDRNLEYSAIMKSRLRSKADSHTYSFLYAFICSGYHANMLQLSLSSIYYSLIMLSNGSRFCPPFKSARPALSLYWIH